MAYSEQPLICRFRAFTQFALFPGINVPVPFCPLNPSPDEHGFSYLPFLTAERTVILDQNWKLLQIERPHFAKFGS